MELSAATDRDAILAVLDEAEAAQDKLESLNFDALTPLELLEVLARRERLARRQPAIDHKLLNRLVAEASPADVGATTMPKALAYKLKISASDASRRIEDASDLGPRFALTGEPLEPKLPNVARVQASGLIGADHLKTIRWFFTHLPISVDLATKIDAERDLAQLASKFGPEHFRKAAERMLAVIDQDGEYNDEDRRRRRGLKVGKQGVDGTTPFSGNLTPEGHAVLEAVLAKLAAPGMCNPSDAVPCVDGTPTEEQVKADTRTVDQRNHDALVAMGRALLASGKLGQLNGLPVTVIVTTTLKELESAAGQAVTAGGTLLPMADLIRMASHAYHYLAIFDGKGKALHLGRSRRTASPAQRLVLYARDRGCTAPGCTVPAYKTQVHHAEKDWADGGKTDIDDLTLACGPDNRKVKPGGWRTRRREDGRTEWIPPPHLDDGSPRVNDYHHPENMITPDDP